MDDATSLDGRHVQLWGGAEDGATLWVPSGALPRLIGAHRTADGALVPIRGGRVLDQLELPHVQVYRRALLVDVQLSPLGTRLNWLAQVRPDPIYVHRDLVDRWTARGIA